MGSAGFFLELEQKIQRKNRDQRPMSNQKEELVFFTRVRSKGVFVRAQYDPNSLSGWVT